MRRCGLCLTLLIADEMQLADELPMIYTVCIMAYATFTYRRTARAKVLIAAGLVGLAGFITVCAKSSAGFINGAATDGTCLGLLPLCKGPRVSPGCLRPLDGRDHLPRLLCHGVGPEAKAQPTESRRV